jgi:uncharacterized protein (DUF1501 family)
MDRRLFIKGALGLPGLFAGGSLYAAPSDVRLLVVFLRGAYDATNIIVPTSSTFYYEARPTLAIQKPGTHKDAALVMDSDWGLHPCLKNSIHPLFLKKQAAFLPFAGTHDLSRSHFRTQDVMEMGQPAQARKYGQGFLGRLAGVLVQPRPIAFAQQLPLIFRGGASIPTVALNSMEKPPEQLTGSALIQAMYQGTELQPVVAQGFRVEEDIRQTFSADVEQANRGAVSTKGFSLAASRISTLMKHKYNLGFVDVGGWDTHAGQGGASGYLAKRMAEFGEGMSAFAQGMGPVWDRTLVLVISEFGRTFRENGNRGTDHGHGSVYWVLGGSVAGGRLLGEQVRLTPETLFQKRDYPVLNEYRAVLGGIFQRLYGLSKAQLDLVFPAAAPADLGIL